MTPETSTELEELRQRVAQLELEHNLLRGLLDAIPVYVYFKDRERRFVAVSQHFRGLFDCEIDDIIGKRDEDLFPKDVAKATSADDLRVIETGESVVNRVEGGESITGEPLYVLTTKVPWLDDDGNTLGLIGISKEITDLKLAEERLRSSEAEGQALLRAMPDLVFRLSRSGEYLACHAPEQQNLVVPLEELIGRTVVEVLPVEVADQVLRHIPLAIDGPTTEVFEYDLDIDGRGHRNYEARMVRYGPDEVLSIVRDVTERRIIERRLIQAEKLDAIGKLASGVAHDFNNQLGVILGNGDLLTQHLDDPELRAWADDICQAAVYSQRLTQQLLAFARKVEHDRVPMDLHVTIGRVAALLRRTLERKITVELALRATRSTILGDQVHLETALLNLALNARDAMPDGGRVIISSDIVHDSEGDQLEVRVEDSGVGIPLEQQDYVFEPFYTTKEVGKGTGLGLPMVFGTVTSHGGTIELTSEPGQGTVFSLRFPLADRKVDVPVEAPAELLEVSPRRIFVVDDEPLVRAAAARILRSFGHEVMSFATGKAAVEHCDGNLGAVDLVILDLDMPGMDGLQTMKFLRQADPNVKVLLSSGHGMKSRVDAHLEIGKTAFLAKPYRVAELKNQLANLLVS